jgi:uncharacterized LabA/DUF88 family protein
LIIISKKRHEEEGPMPRTMVFIDGTWLYKNIPRLRAEFGEEEYEIDYGKLPQVIAAKIADSIHSAATDVDVVRTCLFGSYPDPETLVDMGDRKAALRQLAFFGGLKEEYHYEVEPYAIDFLGRRLSKRDRDFEYMQINQYIMKIGEDLDFKNKELEKLEKELDTEKRNDQGFGRALDNPRLHINSKKRLLQRKWGYLKANKYFVLQDMEIEEKWEPKEKCVDIALSTTMLYFAAIPYAYDIAVAIIGDADYKPVLQRVRHLGKRVMIASIRGSCPEEFFFPTDPERLRDFDTLFINDILPEIRLELKKEKRECYSCKKVVWEAYFLRKGKKYYCPECREKHYQEVKSRYPGVVEEPTEEKEDESTRR